MSCKVMVSVISEQVRGDIGDDWAYTVEAFAVNDGVRYPAERFSIPEHRIKPFAAPKPPPQQQVVPLRAGDCASAAYVTINVTAAEIDAIFDDSGPGTVTIPIECPGHPGPRTNLTHTLTIDVKERPGFLGGQAQLILELSIVAWCE